MVKPVPGIYKLENAEVVNPAKDRRSKDWFKQPTFPTGTYIVRKRWATSEEMEIVRMDQKWGITEPRAHHRDPDSGYQREAQAWDNLCAALVPSERRDVYTHFKLHAIEAYNADDILQILYKNGKITLDDIVAAYNQWSTEDVPE